MEGVIAVNWGKKLLTQSVSHWVASILWYGSSVDLIFTVFILVFYAMCTTWLDSLKNHCRLS